MKKILISSILLAGLFSAAFAQTSKTNESTAGIFGNDVDDYMGVNSWENVNPEKMFGFLGVGASASHGAESYDIGFAKKFGDIYWGTFFGGDIGNYSSTTVEPKNGDSVTTSTSSGTDATWYTFNNIIGIGNMGIKLDFDYYNYNSTYNDATGKENSTNNVRWNLGAEFGINLEGSGKALKPHLGLAYGYNFADLGGIDIDIDGDGTTDNYGRKIVVEDKEYDYTVSNFTFNAGIDVEFDKNEGLQHILSLDADFETWIKGSDIEDLSHSELGLIPAYKVTYDASDDLSLGAKISLPLGFDFGDTFGFATGPELSAGLSYKAKEKFTLNAGIDFALIALSYASADNDAGKTSTFAIDGNDGYVSFHTGFNYALNEKVNFDFTWNILNTLFGGDFKTNFATGTTSDAFWGNLNSVFKPQFGFIAIIKL